MSLRTNPASLGRSASTRYARIALSSSELKKRGALLRVNLADDLPLIKADRVQIQQVILNLLLNGADAMVDIESRSRDLLVRTSRADRGAVTLSVLDTGIGVDSGSIEKLFDAFYTTKKNGMGVGLRSLMTINRFGSPSLIYWRISAILRAPFHPLVHYPHR